MPRSRRHVLNTPRMVYTTYRGLDGETVTTPYIVNSGKIWQGVKGHGGTTSRVKRVKRQRWNDLVAVVEALPPLETRLPLSAFPMRLEPYPAE